MLWVVTVISLPSFFVVRIITPIQGKEVLFKKRVAVSRYNSVLFHSLCAIWTFFAFAIENRKATTNQMLMNLDRQCVTKYCS